MMTEIGWFSVELSQFYNNNVRIMKSKNPSIVKVKNLFSFLPRFWIIILIFVVDRVFQ